MLRKVFRWILTVVGLVLGYSTLDLLFAFQPVKSYLGIQTGSAYSIILMIIGIIVFGIIFYVIAPFIINITLMVTGFIESGLQKLPAYDMLIGIGGLIIGLILANLLLSPFKNFFQDSTVLSIIGGLITLITNVIFGILGVNLALKRKDDMYNVMTSMKRIGKDRKSKSDTKPGVAQPKILDTSVIIDGRILDILKTGFVEGTIIIPGFVLQELRHIADSSDSLKRTRGRRGLDILNQIQKELPVNVEISEKDFEGNVEVDSKLLKLAQLIGGKVITNDFNLNKVAEFQGVAVLNINELSNAVKPVVIPGEEMHIQIIKDGKESGQGVAYLDDGTMIVVEGGKRYVGELSDVIVTSVLQTAAGRMIFARMKGSQDRAAM